MADPDAPVITLGLRVRVSLFDGSFADRVTSLVNPKIAPTFIEVVPMGFVAVVMVTVLGEAAIEKSGVGGAAKFTPIGVPIPVAKS